MDTPSDGSLFNDFCKGPTVAGLTIEELHDALGYDPETGIFIWKSTSSINPKAQAGMRAGSQCTNGYRVIKIGRIRYLAHRLAWFYVHGFWPAELDHINCIRDDNRISNLRVSTRSQNMANSRLQRNNASGVKGAMFDKANQKWLAYVNVNGRFRNLGRFVSKDDAITARRNSARKAFGDFARE
jgi:hypothetical protein